MTPSASPGDKISRPPGPPTSPHILVVDDEPILLRMVEAILHAGGYRVTTASDGAEAWRVWAANPAAFDLVILDAVMPGMSGHEVLAQVRARRAGLPVLLMSGHPDMLRSGWCSEARPSGTLGKPFTAGELLAAVADGMRRG
jgi:CheY-like chemotaxis protein